MRCRVNFASPLNFHIECNFWKATGFISEKLMAPQEFEVNSIRKRNSSDRHGHITHIGNNLDRWMMTAEDVMKRIESCGDAFYIVDRKIGKRAYVEVIRGDGSRPPYFRTRIDNEWRDDLLAQRRCDEGCQLIG